MCGIAGVFFKESVNAEAELAFKALVKSAQSSRGPDAFNDCAITKNLYFYHNRLSIIDLHHAHQPMQDQKGVITFNGEIYNYQELKDIRYPYKTASDTEVLLAGFGKDKYKFLNQTHSMFGFAHYDKHTKEITLCRDRIGVKQLYYIDTPTVFAFASTVKPLCVFSDKIINKNSLWQFYLNRSFHAPNTLFTDIKELQNGQALTIDTHTGKKNLHKWYIETPIVSAPKLSPTAAIETIESKLISSIKHRLVADVPIGIFLSGGVDSSLIAALASKLGHSLEAFTVSSHDSRMDEAKYAKNICQKYGLVYNELKVTGASFLNSLQDWLENNDDVVADPSGLVLYKLAELARDKGYKVILAGEGADEIFGGYHNYKRLKYTRCLNHFVRNIPFAQSLANKITFNDPRYQHFFNMIINKPEYLGNAVVYDPDSLNMLLLNSEGDWQLPKATTLREALDMDITYRLPNDLLTRTDRATMGASIEARVPFLCHELVAFSRTIPVEMNVTWREQKLLLKKMAEKYLPKENIYRKKMGFEIPIHNWLKDVLKDLFMSCLTDSQQRSHINLSYVENLYQKHCKNELDASAKLWAFMSLEISLRKLKAIDKVC